ncbi:DEAD/DEAH box helicase [Sphingobacterium rhinopitheci]|uniref:DEAD/DEAH box helicase n=1 Tax=Sphingobacterium rhinopitheci TaxID=2781960 RepID=UPI001F51EB60|nr:DEAD/DEAH box helicase [Sphingobacterium rhinopitheci]MCI0921334.1 DEAD/DEAH box helicase [Sphingobacterium rhinopitheci]
MSFESLGLSPALLKNLADEHFTIPTPIQLAAIPAIMNKKDVLAIAKTGSGKTASYVLPLIMNLGHVEPAKNRHINTLILVPTRELAEQIKGVFTSLAKNLTPPIKTLAVYGGSSINPQMIAMQGVNVLIATPGRLIELVESNAVHLSSIQMLVLDEADKMLSLGFKEEVDKIISLLPRKRQNILLSATLNSDLENINQLVLKDPTIIKIEDDELEEAPIDSINQLAYLVSPEKKGPYLRQLIEKQDMQQVLIFASSIFQVDAIVNKLCKNNIKARAIHGKKSQGSRTESLSLFKAGKLRVLVATDLMARGIDINNLPFVINYELPRSPKDYIHRIGRTGRADNIGTAISLITPSELHHFTVIEKKIKKSIPLIDIEREGK